MAKPLDILALEPFYGGVRRAMLEAIARCSRHRWTILKLPARKIERRLLVAATWFAEHLSRNTIGRVDILFTSEALNLADFLRLVPQLAAKPSVVYFHDTQLPDPSGEARETPVDLVNLNSASAASEIWFNSLFNLRTFLARASGMVARHPELASKNPMASLTGKSHLVPPPIDLIFRHDGDPFPDLRNVLLDPRDAEPEMIIDALATMARRRERANFTVIGRMKGIPSSLSTTTLRERDEQTHINALSTCGLVITGRRNAPMDHLIVRALAAGCQPLVPRSGIYPELIPELMHRHSLYEPTAEGLTEKLLDMWYLEHEAVHEMHLRDVLAQFDASKACKLIDERIEALAAHRPATAAS